MDTVERWSFDPVELQELLREFELTGPVIPDGVDEFCRRFRLWITSHSPHDESVEAHLADLHFIQGMVNTARGNDQYAIEDLHESIDFSRGVRNPRRQILALCSVATCLECAGMQAEASSRVLEALELAEDLDDDRTLVAVLHSLTALYQAQGAYEQMLDAALRTLAVAERLGDRPTMLRTHSAVSLAYGHLERPDEGFASLSKGFDLIDADTPPRSTWTLRRSSSPLETSIVPARCSASPME